jgi:hypothetical protein
MDGGKVVSGDEVDGVDVPHAATRPHRMSRPSQNLLA